jgi:hypothetical protein
MLQVSWHNRSGGHSLLQCRLAANHQVCTKDISSFGTEEGSAEEMRALHNRDWAYVNSRDTTLHAKNGGL